MNDENIIYASVDLELSGFDPAVDEIIEIGIVRFCLDGGSVVVMGTWQSLIRPSAQIRNRVLGLTGIDASEADRAPLWSEVRELVAEQLRGVCIVGHGVELDIKFLRAQGIELGGNFIDTLELAQIFLPTHHSYNLENLAYELQVSHVAAHRALADAEAAKGVLLQIAAVYQGLPPVTRQKIADVAFQKGFVWMGFIQSVSVLPFSLPNLPVAASKLAVVLEPPQRGETVITLTSPGQPVEPEWPALQTSIPPWVVAFASREQVLQTATIGGAEAYLGAFETLAPLAVQHLLSRVDELTSREVVALLKVMVWQASGPTHNILAEVNWSIIGTELKRLFTAGYSSRTPAGLAVSDFRSLPDFKDKRNAWINDLDVFSAWLEQKSGIQFGWQSSVGALQRVYNPETGFGSPVVAQFVTEALAAIDLFFVRVMLLLKSELHASLGVTAIDSLNPYAWTRIVQAARNLNSKLQLLISRGGVIDPGIARMLENMENLFFKPNATQLVRWVEFGESRCMFFARSASLRPAYKAALSNFSAVTLQTDVRNKTLLEFFIARLGLSSAQVVEQPAVPSVPLHKHLSIAAESLELEVTHRLAGAEKCLVVFPDVAYLKTFYDTVYPRLTENGAAIVAVSIHGGVQKIFRNFSHSARQVVLASYSHLSGFSGAVSAKRVICAGLPQIDTAHPYNRLLAASYFSSDSVFKSHMQLLICMQMVRALNLDTVREFELLVESADAVTARMILDELP